MVPLQTNLYSRGIKKLRNAALYFIKLFRTRCTPITQMCIRYAKKQWVGNPDFYVTSKSTNTQLFWFSAIGHELSSAIRPKFLSTSNAFWSRISSVRLARGYFSETGFFRSWRNEHNSNYKPGTLAATSDTVSINFLLSGSEPF